jgi:hypothetical protein
MESKLHQLTINLELSIKLMFYNPLPLMNDSIKLVHYLLRSRFEKIGVFAVYCVALMLQDPHKQSDCLVNLMTMFGDEVILSHLFDSLTVVDVKFKKWNELAENSEAKKNPGDILKGYE